MFVIEDALLRNLNIDEEERDELVNKWEFNIAIFDTYEEASAVKTVLDQGRNDDRFSIKEVIAGEGYECY